MCYNPFNLTNKRRLIVLKIRQVRNATLKITYADKVFLVDPWLVGGQKFGRFVDIPEKSFRTPDPVREQIPMPIFDLPASVEEILHGVDYYIVTHIHPDHIDISPDGTLGAPLVKNIPVNNMSNIEIRKTLRAP